MNLRGLNNSRLRSFRACQRRHHYEYTLGRKPVRPAHALAFGTTIHTALAAYWNARGHAADGESAALATLVHVADPFDQARAAAMVRLYAAHWDLRDVEVLAIEHTFALPLINPATGAPSRTWQLKGTVDLIARVDGRIAVVEHKTSSEDVSSGSQYQQRLALDSQVSQYFEGAEALGYAPEVCLYDVLSKPTIKPLKSTPPEARKYTKAGTLYATQREFDETPDEYSQRLLTALAEDPQRYITVVEVPRLVAERAEWQFDVWQLGQQMRDGERLGFAPKNPDACFRYGSPCPYLDVCQRTASIDDPSRFVSDETSTERGTVDVPGTDDADHTQAA